MSNIEKGTNYEVYIKNFLENENSISWLWKNIPEFDLMKGLAQRNLSKIEILNRDYYRGRFISRSKKDGEYIYNWEDKPIN